MPSTTAYTYVGNLGCIRFPPEVRSASGIKRGDRLIVSVKEQKGIVLEKLEVAPGQRFEGLEVEGCACAMAPDACSNGGTKIVTVGWSYVQLPAALARTIGFLPDAPLRLVGEPSQITVSLHRDRRALKGVARVQCPPVARSTGRGG